MLQWRWAHMCATFSADSQGVNCIGKLPPPDHPPALTIVY